MELSNVMGESAEVTLKAMLGSKFMADARWLNASEELWRKHSVFVISTETLEQSLTFVHEAH